MSLLLTHIECANPDVESCVHHMLCGESCIVFGEWITPLGFDFYSFAHGHKATCTACQTERLRLTANKKEAIDA